MSYATLLSAACGVDGDDDAVSVSAQIAQRQAALVRALPAFPDQTIAATNWGASGAYLAPEVIEEFTRIRADLAGKLSACAEAAAAREGLAFGPGENGSSRNGPRLFVEPVPRLPWRALTLALPLVDLVVMSLGAAKGAGLSSGPFADALMAARAPVLITRGPDFPDKGVVGIAWDGGLEAGRAVRAAMPLLLEAEAIVILQDSHALEQDQREAAAPERLADYLRACGVKSTSSLQVSHGAEGAPLVAAAEKAGAHLLVNGAYGHSRVREWIWGGATRGVLAAQRGPHLLLAH